MNINREKVISVIFWGVVAHYSLPIILLIIKIDSAHISELDVLKGYSSWLVISPIFWSGAIWGYLIGSKICELYIKTKLGVLKSAFIGLAITILSSLTLGYFGGIVQLLDGKSGVIEFLFAPIAAVFVIHIFTAGALLVVGVSAALIFHTICWSKNLLTSNSTGRDSSFGLVHTLT